jgi:hypothetical protein
MSDHGAIAGVSETLVKLLQEGLVGLVAPDHITLASPAEVELDTSPWLGLFLFQVAENHRMKNQSMERLDPLRLQHPAFVVDLSYLVIPYAQTRETEHLILGRVIQVFAGHPVLLGSRLQGSLAGSTEELRVLFHPLSTEELFRLWNAFHTKPFKLSLCYQVSPVKIDTILPPVGVPPVVERTLRYRGGVG